MAEHPALPPAKPRGTRWYRFVLFAAREIGFRLLGGIRVVGRENVPMEGPLLVCPNHFSHLDPPVVACAIDRALCFMAKEELFRVAVLGPLIRSLDAFPVRRGVGDTEAIKLAIDLVKSGRAVLVFPEGTRGDGIALGDITPGIAMLAKRTAAKVLPVGIVGTERVWPRGQKRLRRGRITVVFGEPFAYEDWTAGMDGKQARESFVDELGRRIVQLCSMGGLDLSLTKATQADRGDG